MDVNWGGSLILDKKNDDNIIPIQTRMWHSIIEPKKVSDLIGNKDSISDIDKWFKGGRSNKCLIIHGPPGTGKTTAVKLLAKENGFQLLDTKADTQRTCQKMGNNIRKVSIYGKKGILLLDDAETFISETSGTKYLTKLIKSNTYKFGVILIINQIDTSLENIACISTVVKFDKVSAKDTYSIFQRITSRVRKFSMVPPFASYIISNGVHGSITQSLTHLQYIYQDLKPIVHNKKKRKGVKLIDPQAKSKKDSGIHMWANTYKRSNIDHILADKDDFMDTMMNMNKDFMKVFSKNLYRDYLYYFGNSSISSISAMDNCISYMSLANTFRPENHKDRLYDTENHNRWVEDDMNFIVYMIGSLNILKGRKKYGIDRHKKNRRVFNYYS